MRSLRRSARLLDHVVEVGLSVLRHQLLVFLPQGVHPVNHLLHKLDLAKRKCCKRKECNSSLLTSEYPSLCLFEMS